MSLKRGVWDQLKNTTAKQLIRALEKDGWEREETTGATQGYWHPDGRRVVIHYHPKKTYGAGLLKGLITDIGWTESDLKRLKLIKK